MGIQFYRPVQFGQGRIELAGREMPTCRYAAARLGSSRVTLLKSSKAPWPSPDFEPLEPARIIRICIAAEVFDWSLRRGGAANLVSAIAVSA